MLDRRRSVISAVFIVAILAATYTIYKRFVDPIVHTGVVEGSENEQPQNPDASTWGNTCANGKIRNDAYAQCVCPEGLSGDTCNVNDRCNGRAPPSMWFASEDNEQGVCKCSGPWEKFNANLCVCTKDETGTDLGLGFKENCCGAHGHMEDGYKTCACDSGWVGKNCETAIHFSATCEGKPCTNNTEGHPVICKNSLCGMQPTGEAFKTCVDESGGSQICTYEVS